MNVALVVTTLGREAGLHRLLESLADQMSPADRIVIVAQRNLAVVQSLAAGFSTVDCEIIVTTSELGASTGRNAGVAELPTDTEFLLNFPNDTTWFEPGMVERMRRLPEDFQAGALTVVDENGPKFVLPPAGTQLTKRTVWSVIEMGVLMRRSVFDALGGFDPTIGTGATTPWQAGESTDLLLKLLQSDRAMGFAWQPADLFVGGIADPSGLTTSERRHKLRGYARGLGRLVTRWRYPLWWRLAFLGGGFFFGLRNRNTNTLTDGWWVFLGRLEGMIGHTLGRSRAHTAVTR
ncbi:glycosyltransferase involved in cell wall biosynthesis [Cryobacterium sp. CAN_C3]|uniref:glycosyltransferase family 2 protein n=1 Tax=unclassified Cryobacterium TaxID=2649013 RepID=UPI0018CA5DDC|nr:glycosyltransferase [Cryobacterium sp. CAN_C3]MCY7298878.1 glycosyltransferase [Ilumatobacteraceae bacterium]MEC5155816.1 glycosyltransferase involved in cell wall biosynthesis [Cryobacterium sp. CAN_C3]